MKYVHHEYVRVMFQNKLKTINSNLITLTQVYNELKSTDFFA